jgi:hypothetical protein
MANHNSNSRKGFITIPLSEKTYNFLSKISFAKTRVPKGAKTDTHKHRFFSAYLVKNMDSLWTEKGIINMPERALVIVLPFVNHTWSNKVGTTDDCYVSDLSPVHGKHMLYQ